MPPTEGAALVSAPPQPPPETDRVVELRRQLVAILRESREGDKHTYDEVVKELRLLFETCKRGGYPIECRKLAVLIRALASCASEIAVQRHWSLCSEMLNVQFIDQPKEIRDALIEWFGNVMMTTSALIPGCLSSLAVSLVPFLPRVPVKDPLTKWTSPDPLPDIHKTILDLVEKAKQPFVMRPCESHCLYVTAVFDLMHRPIGAHLQEKLWTLVVHHLLDVDVHIHVQDLDRSANLGRDVENMAIFNFELNENVPYQRTDADPKSKQLMNLITVMDALMEMVLAQLERQIVDGHLSEIWKIMMRLLDGLLISTHEAQFTHFLVFYLAQKNPEEFVDALTAKCLSVVQDSFSAPIVRSAYALYIASFLSRAKFATAETKLKCLEMLLVVCETYARQHTQERELRPQMSNQSFGSSNVDVSVKHEFFCVCMQSVMYMMCYLIPVSLEHSSSKEGMSNELRELIQTRLSPLLYHWLDPLNRIAAAVAVQFAELVEHYGIIQCKHLIDTVELYQGKTKLQAYFPFDPYCLQRSSAFLNLETSYMAWNEIAVDTHRDTMETEDTNDDALDERIMETLSLEDNSTLASSLPLHNSIGSSLLSDGL